MKKIITKHLRNYMFYSAEVDSSVKNQVLALKTEKKL